MSNKIIMSGMQTSGKLHLGNYIGAIQNWQNLSYSILQKNGDCNCFFMLADLHSLTTQKNPKLLYENRIDCLISYIACGILDFNKNTNIYFQSDIPEIPYLCWILSNLTKLGELNRMTQFKDKKGKENQDNINSGLLFYPILMAADVLILNADFVPVGEDQKQHLEIIRNIAECFNQTYSSNNSNNVFQFTLPQEIIIQHGKRVMSLKNPEKKMSKSTSSDMEIIYLTDTKDEIAKKIKSATTDSIKGIYYDKENRAGISNLIEIFSSLSKRTVQDISDFYIDKDTKTFKDDLIQIIINAISPIRDKILNLENNKSEIYKIAHNGQEKVREIANKNLILLKQMIGL